MANPFVHVELNTNDVASAKKFYKGLFKWKLKDVKMGPTTYTMLDVGKGVGGGMMTKPMPEAPYFWLSYVQVDDVKKTIAKARALGAQVIVDYKEVEGSGSLGIFADPSGAVLGVWQPRRKAPAKRNRDHAAYRTSTDRPSASSRRMRRR